MVKRWPKTGIEVPTGPGKTPRKSQVLRTLDAKNAVEIAKTAEIHGRRYALTHTAAKARAAQQDFSATAVYFRG